MYSVILTELGIIVSDKDTITKTFPFSDTVGQYLAIKNKEGVSNDLVRYLEELQVGFTISDESLLFIIKKKEIDAQLMDESKMEEIQSTKPQLLIDASFAKDPKDALEKLREFAISLSSTKVTQISESPDLHIIQAINSLDEIDKIANALSSRLREWYGLHFPELENLIDSINGYSQIVMAGKRENLTEQVFEDAGFPESKVEMLKVIQEKSKGGDISKENLAIVQSLAKQILEMHKMRKDLEDHLETQMNAIAPNLTVILGNAVGARLLARAGSLRKLASMPASTIQILGAEKALFRSLKTGSQPPKHGLLFQHAMVHSAPRWQRGKIARVVAAKAAIASRVDVYGEGLNETLLEKLNVRVKEIGEKYSEPVKREPQKFDDRRSRGGDDRYSRDGGDDRRSRGGDDRRSRGGDDRRSRGGDDRRSRGGDDRRSRGGDDRRSRGGDDRRSRGGDDRRSRGGDDRYSRDGGDDRRSRGGDDRRSRGGDDRYSRDGGDDRRSRGGDDRYSRDGGDDRRPMFSATCDKCGVDCELPFRPNQGKPVFCNNCFNRDAPRDNRSRSNRQPRGGRDGDRFSRDQGRPKEKGKQRKKFGRR